MVWTDEHDGEAQRVHAIVLTHTTRWLDWTLHALLTQSSPPDSIVVSCDVDNAEIAELAARSVQAAQSAGSAVPPCAVVLRPHTGVARLNQVRNNALRALRDLHAPAPQDLAIVLDGDTMLERTGVQVYRAVGETIEPDLVIPFRVNLSERASSELARRGFGGLPADWDCASVIGEAESRDLDRRHRRYERQMMQRRLGLARLGLVKAHKPKILGGHHAVSWRAFEAVNGYDERYEGYGYDDDDLSRRILALRPAPIVAIAVNDIHAVHLWHPSRAPASPTEAPGWARFSTRGLPVRAEAGLDSPVDQPAPRVIRVGAEVPA